jgi:hypothetical protein
MVYNMQFCDLQRSLYSKVKKSRLYWVGHMIRMEGAGTHIEFWMEIPFLRHFNLEIHDDGRSL